MNTFSIHHCIPRSILRSWSAWSSRGAFFVFLFVVLALLSVRVAIAGNLAALTMDEEEAKNDGHTTETLGWIAIKRGTGNTADNRSVVVLSSSTNHIPTQISFGQSMARRFPVVVSDMITTYGSDPGFLRYQNLGPSQHRSLHPGRGVSRY